MFSYDVRTIIDLIRFHGPIDDLKVVPVVLASAVTGLVLCLGGARAVKTLLTRPRGMFLVTGPTGSGKSTTLASCVDFINQEMDYHIITIEDPIEFYHKHQKSIITQREIGVDVG